MKAFSRLIIQPALLIAGVVVCFIASAADLEPGFKSLFNGKDLTGWDGNPTFWRVENGAIVGETTAEKQPADKKNTFLIYRVVSAQFSPDGKSVVTGSRGSEFGDFELRFRYKVEGFNSGVQYRSVEKGDWHVDGLQADFEARWHEDKKDPGKGKFDQFSGMFFEENGRMFMGQRGDVVIVRANKENPKKPKIEKIASLGDPQELEKAIKRDGWNDYTVIADGKQFTHIINGRVMAIGIDEDELNFRKSGILAFQLHSGTPMKIEVKDIRIRALK